MKVAKRVIEKVPPRTASSPEKLHTTYFLRKKETEKQKYIPGIPTHNRTTIVADVRVCGRRHRQAPPAGSLPGIFLPGLPPPDVVDHNSFTVIVAHPPLPKLPYTPPSCSSPVKGLAFNNSRHFALGAGNTCPDWKKNNPSVSALTFLGKEKKRRKKPLLRDVVAQGPLRSRRKENDCFESNAHAQHAQGNGTPCLRFSSGLKPEYV